MPPSQYHLLAELYSAFRDKDIRELRRINDKSASSIAVEFDQSIYDISILSYILAKLVSKPRFWSNPDSKANLTKVRAILREASEQSRRGDTTAVAGSLQAAFSQIRKIESADRRFISDFEQKAKLKLASTLYAQGFSLGNAANVTGVEKREILSYAGKTMMFDRLKSELAMGERLKRIRKIFKA
ncbi:MAG: hypothetical protein WC506_03815 [Candidatus Micrarchaeia archaeon]